MKNHVPAISAGVYCISASWNSFSRFIKAVSLSFFFIVTVPLWIFSQRNSFALTEIPFSSTDLIAPGRGVEHWNGVDWDNNRGVMVPSGNTEGLNMYRRFNWKDFEETTSGAYDWSQLDWLMNKAIDEGKMVSFSLMPMCTSCGDFGSLTYPKYLHEAMQMDAVDKRDWLNAQGFWVPNWNSEIYLSRFEALLNAIAAHLKNTSRNGIRYQDIIFYVDIRGYGDFGEWHTWPFTGTEPAGRAATVSTLIRIIDAHKNAFPDFPLVIPMGAFDTGGGSQIPAEVGYYALTTTNNWGQIGWRRDNLGDVGFSNSLEYNSATYNNVTFSSLIMNKWKYAPVGGEPYNDANAITDGGTKPAHFDLPVEMQRFHMTFFGNGNYPLMNDDLRTNVINASKISGYRIIPSNGSINSNLIPGNTFSVTLDWKNTGVAPVYENWDIYYQIRNSSGTVVWTDKSTFNLKLFLPQSSPNSVTDNFVLPQTIPNGTYSLYLIIKDPTGYKKPLPLAITGRNSDGSYLLTNVIVGTASTNSLPVANAGKDTLIHSPSSKAQLNGSGTDRDGSIASYQWSRISGPNTPVISAPLNPVTEVSGLIPGTYFMKLMVTDNSGGAGTDTMVIKVNRPPSVDAGRDTLMALKGNSIQLRGVATDNDGSVVSYQWTKVSGPDGAILNSAQSSSTSVSGVRSGTYVFLLTVVDNDGASASDNIQIQLNLAPTAVAGKDTALFFPAKTAQLDGSASFDTDGKILTYLWKQVGGPMIGKIVTPTQRITDVTDLAPGVFNFELSVTDDLGIIDKDTVTVTVNSNLRTVAYFRVYPNPADAYLTISLLSDSLINGTVDIYDLNGHLMKKWSFQNSIGYQKQVDIKDLSKGVYLLEIMVANRYRLMRKFVKL